MPKATPGTYTYGDSTVTAYKVVAKTAWQSLPEVIRVAVWIWAILTVMSIPIGIALLLALVL